MLEGFICCQNMKISSHTCQVPKRTVKFFVDIKKPLNRKKIKNPYFQLIYGTHCKLEEKWRNSKQVAGGGIAELGESGFIADPLQT